MGHLSLFFFSWLFNDVTSGYDRKGNEYGAVGEMKIRKKHTYTEKTCPTSTLSAINPV
jgi:hypothetical protein